MGKVRLDRMTAMRNAPPSDDPAERMRLRATVMTDAGAALKKLADATDPLYKSLDEGQKRRFAILGRVAGPGMMDRFRGHDAPRHHWLGPQRTEGGPMHMEHTGEQRL